MSLVPYPISDTEQDEQGKIRTVPHTPGLWPTLIYISGKTMMLLNIVPMDPLKHILQLSTKALTVIESTIQPIQR